jgi:hypothetical protein
MKLGTFKLVGVLPIDAVDILLKLMGTEWFEYLCVGPSGMTGKSRLVLSAAAFEFTFGD